MQYSLTLTNVAQSNLSITLNNGEIITIAAGETSGSVQVDSPADDLLIDADTISNYVSDVSGGNFENLIIDNGANNPVTTEVEDSIDTVFAVLSGSDTVTEGEVTSSYQISLIDSDGNPVTVVN